MHKLLIVSTCGTSLLRKGATRGDEAWLTDVANDITVDAARLTSIVATCRARLAAADEATRRRVSAELNGIGATFDKWKPDQYFHLLVHTDTALGRAAADLVQTSLGDHVALMSASGLRTNDLASFRAALADITKQLDDVVRSYREKGWFVIFNLTGGFKSLNAYLQSLGMILADRCVFLFESASELMEIPRLPVRLSDLDDLRTHLTVFRRLAVGYLVTADQARSVPESLLMEHEGVVTTSVLGDVAWARHREALFCERILQPLSADLRVLDPVHKAFAALEPSQKVQVNEALDEFSAFIDSVRPQLKSRTFKKLQGNPVPGSTHELYAWSDGATGRLLGHYAADGAFVFDRLTNHM